MKLSSLLILLGAALTAANPLLHRAEGDIVADESVTSGPAIIAARADDAVAAEDTGADAPQAELVDVPAPPPLSNDTTGVEPVKRSPNGEIDPRAYQSLTWQHNPWKFSVKVNGDHLITFWSSGYVRFKTHFRATGFWSYDYAITCAVRDIGGRVYTLSRKGRVRGTIEPGSRNHDVDQTRYNADVQRNWNDIVRGDRIMHCKVKVANSISFNLIKKLLGEVLKLVKAAAAVIAIF